MKWIKSHKLVKNFPGEYDVIDASGKEVGYLSRTHYGWEYHWKTENDFGGDTFESFKEAKEVIMRENYEMD